MSFCVSCSLFACAERFLCLLLLLVTGVVSEQGDVCLWGRTSPASNGYYIAGDYVRQPSLYEGLNYYQLSNEFNCNHGPLYQYFESGAWRIGLNLGGLADIVAVCFKPEYITHPFDCERNWKVVGENFVDTNITVSDSMCPAWKCDGGILFQFSPYESGACVGYFEPDLNYINAYVKEDALYGGFSYLYFHSCAGIWICHNEYTQARNITPLSAQLHSQTEWIHITENQGISIPWSINDTNADTLITCLSTPAPTSNSQPKCVWNRMSGLEIHTHESGTDYINGNYIWKGLYNGINYYQLQRSTPTNCISSVLNFYFENGAWFISPHLGGLQDIELECTLSAYINDPVLCGPNWKVGYESVVDAEITVTDGLCPSWQCPGGVLLIYVPYQIGIPCIGLFMPVTDSSLPNLYRKEEGAFGVYAYLYYHEASAHWICSGTPDGFDDCTYVAYSQQWNQGWYQISRHETKRFAWTDDGDDTTETEVDLTCNGIPTLSPTASPSNACKRHAGYSSFTRLSLYCCTLIMLRFLLLHNYSKN